MKIKIKKIKVRHFKYFYNEEEIKDNLQPKFAFLYLFFFLIVEPNMN